jgi:membrane protein YdbS with pleckstrin-like domain
VGYLDQSLTSGEVVLYRTRLHWSVLFWPLAATVLLGAAAVGLFVAAARANAEGRPGPFVVAGLACLLVAAMALVIGQVRRSSTEMAVTNRRVLMKTGMLGRRTVELMLSKVESIGVDQGAWGRLVGFGKVTVRGTGGTCELFERIDQPLEFRRQVQEQINQLQPPEKG